MNDIVNNGKTPNHITRPGHIPYTILLTGLCALFLNACDGATIEQTRADLEDIPGTPITDQSDSTDLQTEPQAEPDTPPTTADITDLILITGQSNTLGAGTGYDKTLDASNESSFAYTSDGWQVADLHQVWDGKWYPRAHPDSAPSNNFGLHFGKQVVERDSNRVVAFVLMAAPGEPISHWQSDGSYFSQIRNTVTQAINELPNKSTVDGILWHQGESDGVNDNYYSEALYNLIEDFRNESWFGYERPFICGETAWLPVNQQLRKLNSDNDPWTACVEAEGLSTVRDNDHFSAESLRTIGKRYGDAYLQMTR